ncbi:MAG: MBL fold metallo-hydrolase, partial [Gammaproteobacteria bacterium]|nr:MBL fold metallo-hydrolase [Gammaproteobacteria bacterium]
MIFENFIDNDLGHVSFIFGDEVSKEVVILDPRRDIDEYEQYIKKNNLKVKYILNTHTHADYIGGHLELAYRYKNAKNIFHYKVSSNFEFLKVKDGDILYLGNNIGLNILETP